jgi:hypothetical protein
MNLGAAARCSNAVKPGFHGVRTHWIRGFMAFRLARCTRTTAGPVPRPSRAGPVRCPRVPEQSEPESADSASAAGIPATAPGLVELMNPRRFVTVDN